eukprot:jgi/Bigna1/76532/fgenesh1_pg.42_\
MGRQGTRIKNPPGRETHPQTPCKRCNKHMCAIHYAASNGHTLAIEQILRRHPEMALIETSAAPNARAQRPSPGVGRSQRLFASRGRRESVGTSPSSPMPGAGSPGMTALQIACQESTCSIESIEYLADQTRLAERTKAYRGGDDANTQGGRRDVREGFRCVTSLMVRQAPNFLHFLLSSGEKATKKLILVVCCTENILQIEGVIKRGVLVIKEFLEERDHDGKTPLLYAVFSHCTPSFIPLQKIRINIINNLLPR